MHQRHSCFRQTCFIGCLTRVAHLLSIQEWSDLTLQQRGAYTLSRISGYSWRTRDAVWINLIEEMRVLAKAPPPLLLTTTPRALIGRAARCCRIVRPRRVTFALSHPTTSSAPLPLPLDLWSEYPEVRLELDIGARADSHADILDAAERLSSSNSLWTSHTYFLKYHLRYLLTILWCHPVVSNSLLYYVLHKKKSLPQFTLCQMSFFRQPFPCGLFVFGVEGLKSWNLFFQ